MEDNFECKEKVKVSGNTGQVIEAIFSNTDYKIFASFSYDKTIKVWNVEEPFCICNILVSKYISEMQIYKNFLLITNYS